MKRLKGWAVGLDEMLEKIRRTPFDWSGGDCAIALGAAAVRAITGEDLAAEYRGKYSTAASALKVMKEAGFDDLADLVASMLPEIPVSFARTGDIVTIEKDDEFKSTIGVVNGERVFVLRPDGLGTLDLLQAKRAFKVG
jgi:hypothetical protein